MSPRYVIGIDLGTTHTAIAYVDLKQKKPKSEIFPVPQLVARGSIEARNLLPSFLYLAHESEGAQALPWDAERRFVVGEYARARGLDAPVRLIASAKSWLSHPAIDRRGPTLPIGAPDDIERISPVEASWRYLEHVVEAWDAHFAKDDPKLKLCEQEVILTVPASFDAAAREFTVEAATAAGIEHLTLLEEPQAALYSWIETMGDDWRKEVRPGDVLLVIDVGGGTTDFSAIAVIELDGSLELVRAAVGDHILLGGDNMDLALAHVVRMKLHEEGTELDRFQMNALTHACRLGKERLLNDPSIGAYPISLATRGAKLVGGAVRADLTRKDVETSLEAGFFPTVGATARPATRARAGLTEIGLPYASDAAVTKHLAAFLTRQAAALTNVPGFAARVERHAQSQRPPKMLHPSAVLFNGGVMKGKEIRDRVIAIINSWLEGDGGRPLRALEGVDLDLAVARGAALYGLARRGRGVRIRGGTARAYYVGIESAVPAVPGLEPPITALCIAPFGMEEGTEAALPEREFGVVVGEPVRFRFFGSTVRRDDPAGVELASWKDGELTELAPIEMTLPTEGRTAGQVVPVRLRATVTAIGTLELEAFPTKPKKRDEYWKIELGVRAEPGA